MMHLLRHLAAETGRAILLSTHDLDLALRSADTLWLMSGGIVRSGTPEDLVINGTFEKAFHDEGVTFDRATGTFSVERAQGRTVIVLGDGIPHTWTCRALKRAGFQLVSPQAINGHVPLPQITLTGEEDNPVWHLEHHGQQMIYTSIHDLLAGMQQLNDGVLEPLI